MKENNKKIKLAVLLIVFSIIVAGIIVIATVGLNFDLSYQETKRMELYIAKDFEVEDIQKITDEVLENQKVILQKVEVYQDSVSIRAKDITEEQKASIISKVNEKYGTELKADSIEITNVPHTRGRDIIKPYIVPFIIATVIILLYLVIRYYKLGILKVLVEAIALFVVLQAILLSLIAILRVPVGRLTIPMVLIVYIISLVEMTVCGEKNLKEKRKQEEA